MLRSWFKKRWKAVTRTARRITGISTPVGGIQLSAPAPDASFARAQDERELRREIWLLAVQEAYIAKDGATHAGYARKIRASIGRRLSSG